MFKNVASKVAFFVFDTTTGLPKTGDAANLTAYVSKDYGTVTVLADTSATEMDATNAKGWYLFDTAQAESNADSLVFTGKSSTANMSVVGKEIFTTPNRFTTMVIDAAGLVDGNTVKVGPTGSGTAQTAGDIPARLPAALTANGNMKSSMVEILTTALTETAGLLAGGFKKFFNIATPAATMDHGILVDTVTTATTATAVTTVNGLAANVITAASIAADAITDAKVASDVTIASVTGAVGSVTGAVGSVTARVTANADQLAGQTITAAAGVTFPASVASPTNITAGTITTVTNLTNAPTAGDLTATMKTSVTTAATAATPVAASVTGAVGSVTAGVTVTTNNDKTGMRLSATGITDIRDIQLVEGYAADGAAPTMNQAIFQLLQFLTERSITSTTMTVKKLDGSTTAMTFTLDSASSPTSITRAT